MDGFIDCSQVVRVVATVEFDEMKAVAEPLEFAGPVVDLVILESGLFQDVEKDQPRAWEVAQPALVSSLLEPRATVPIPCCPLHEEIGVLCKSVTDLSLWDDAFDQFLLDLLDDLEDILDQKLADRDIRAMGKRTVRARDMEEVRNYWYSSQRRF